MMEPIYSEFADDGDYRELLEDFISAIPARIASIQVASAAGDVDRVKTLVHQLRGACGSYGFHQVTPPAAQLESVLASTRSLSAHQQQVDDFVQLLQCLAMATPCNSGQIAPIQGTQC